MDNMIYALLISVSVPIVLMMLLVEKRARLPIVFMVVGIFCSGFASEMNGLLHNELSVDLYRFIVVITPSVEEIIKALPILFYAVVISDRREKLLTASMALGVGFAVIENTFYLLNYPHFSIINAIIRAFGSGLMHGMCTLLVGLGISFVRKKRKLFLVGTFGLLSVAIVYHGIYNILVQSSYSMVGAALPIVTYIPFLLWRIHTQRRQP